MEKIGEKEYLSLKELKKFEDNIQKQKLKVLEEGLILARLEYKARNLGLYDNIKELFIKKCEASLKKTYAESNFEVALLKDKANELRNTGK